MVEANGVLHLHVALGATVQVLVWVVFHTVILVGWVEVVAT